MNSKPSANVPEFSGDETRKSMQARGLHGLAWVSVFVVAVVLRIHRLHDVSAWYDEAAAWKTIQFSWSEMFASIRQNVHPPVYYILLKLWAGLFGFSPVALRAFSVVCGVMTVPVVALLVSENLDTGSASRRDRGFPLLAAALYAINPLAIEQSQQARMYTLGILFAALLGWGTLRVLKSPLSWSNWLLVIMAGNLLPLTHYYGLFTSLVAAVAIGVRMAGVWTETSLELRNTVWARCGVAILVTLIIWGVWGPTFWSQFSRVRADYWIPPFTWNEPIVYCAEWVSSPWIRDWGRFFGVQLCLACIAGVVWRVRSPAPFRGVMAGFVLAPPVLSTLYSLGSRNLLQDRYWSFAHLFFIAGIVIAVAQWSNHSLRRGLAVGLIVWSLLWVVQDRSHRNLLAEQSGLRGVGETLRIVTLPQEMVLVASPFYHPSVQWYLGIPERIYLPDAGGTYSHHQGGAILRKSEILPLAATLTGNSRRMWVVADEEQSRSLNDPTKLPLPPEWHLGKTFKFFEGNRLPASLEIREYVRN